MPGKGFFQHMGRMFSFGRSIGFLIVFFQQGLIIWMSTVLDQDIGPFFRGQPAQVGNSLLGDDDIHIMFCLVHVTDKGNDGGNSTVFGY